MATLEDFIASVDAVIGEGGAINEKILLFSRMSMRKLERLYNFRYMLEEMVCEVPIIPIVGFQMDLGEGVKTVISGEMRGENGSVVDGEQPIEFTLDPHVRLDDKKFDRKYPMLLRGTRWAMPLLATVKPQDFSFLLIRRTLDWPVTMGETTDYEHPLFNEFEDLYLADVILALMPASRDPDLQAFKMQLEESRKSLFAEGFILNVDDLS